ncbi:hypothetical protein [cf. Phormidesmis sp. LEGE 11477]|uniref:hypothetical protein n=1 Tax=cf. Phormidesmis sp. LEGE 11477 TaxID=1828680 RepID=UPI00188034F2|nr:hypothetical protein [cf. Phormidesmis sp. LEGE 11477]MBE9063625.1 hypothetical protein [cf. Phormidesmis sp. LEGE 11477]
MIKKTLLLSLIVIPGIAGMAIFGYYALQDWGQLQLDYKAYQAVTKIGTIGIETIFKANAAQMIQRINLFADGTWFLLSAIFSSIGLHGFLTSNF